MIRFSCRKCGKSLRADESIIGRSSRCTSCSAVNRVPNQSTRQSGERPTRVSTLNVPSAPQADEQFDDDVVTLIADSNSDSFEGFEDLDLSRLNLTSAPVTNEPFNLTPRDSSNPSSSSPSTTSKPSTTPNRPTSASIPAKPILSPAKVTEASRRSRSDVSWPRMGLPAQAGTIIGVIAICLLASIGYWGYRTFLSGASQSSKTALELSTAGNGYIQVLFEVKKAERVMTFLEKAYREKKMPESGLAGIESVRQEFKTVVDDRTRLEAANKKYEAGDREGANQLLNEQIELLKAVKVRIDRETSSLKARIYGG